MFSTRTNKLEIDIEAVEKKEKEIQELRDRMGHNVFKRAYVQLRRRTAFMATPPRIWLFLILLGIFSALSLYVVVGRCTGAVVAHCRAVRVPVTVRLSHGSNVKCGAVVVRCVAGSRTTACCSRAWTSKVCCEPDSVNM